MFALNSNVRRPHAGRKSVSVLKLIFVAGCMAAISATHAATTPSSSFPEPQKSMEAAHESFVKKDFDKAAEHLHSAAISVKKESENVADKSKADMKKCGEDMDKLGDDVKKGSVKSEEEFKARMAKTNHAIGTCWHASAAETKAAGKDASTALKHAGTSLEHAAKWSGTELKKGTKATVSAVKKAGEATGKGAKAGAAEVDKWFKDIGDGLKDVGHKF
jgi:hypothetical protein